MQIEICFWLKSRVIQVQIIVPEVCNVFISVCLHVYMAHFGGAFLVSISPRRGVCLMDCADPVFDDAGETRPY